MNCPDTGKCQHGCETQCWRVKNAAPLSDAYDGQFWPDEVLREHGAEETLVSVLDFERLKRWTMAYRRLMTNLSHVVHTAAVQQFAMNETEFPYLTVEDVAGLMAEVVTLRAALEPFAECQNPVGWGKDPRPCNECVGCHARQVMERSK